MNQLGNISYEIQLGTAAQRSSLVRSEACGAKKRMVFWQTITKSDFSNRCQQSVVKSVLVDTKAESLCRAVKLEQRRADRMKLRDNLGSEQAERNTV